MAIIIRQNNRRARQNQQRRQGKKVTPGGYFSALRNGVLAGLLTAFALVIGLRAGLVSLQQAQVLAFVALACVAAAFLVRGRRLRSSR